MQSFQDRNGKTWTLDLNIATWRRVKAETGIDLADVMTEREGQSDLQRLTDPIKLMEVIYILCVPAADRATITGEVLMAAMDMETVEKASDALLDEIVNFCRPAVKTILTKLLKLSRNYAAEKQKQMNRMLEDDTMEQALKQAWNTSSPSSPE
mgnify:CR=1 FL=1